MRAARLVSWDHFIFVQVACSAPFVCLIGFLGCASEWDASGHNGPRAGSAYARGPAARACICRMRWRLRCCVQPRSQVCMKIARGGGSEGGVGEAAICWRRVVFSIVLARLLALPIHCWCGELDWMRVLVGRGSTQDNAIVGSIYCYAAIATAMIADLRSCALHSFP